MQKRIVHSPKYVIRLIGLAAMEDFGDISLVWQSSLFQAATPEQLHAIKSHLVRQKLQRGEDLIREGEKSDAIFFVYSGRFRAYRSDAEYPIAEFGVGEIIGEIGFFGGTPRSATVIATRELVGYEVRLGSVSRDP